MGTDPSLMGTDPNGANGAKTSLFTLFVASFVANFFESQQVRA